MKSKLIKGICAIGVVCVLVLGNNAMYVNAEDQNIKVTASIGEKIFSKEQDGIWAPGEEVTKEFNIENISTSKIEIEALDFDINYMYNHINKNEIKSGTKEYKNIAKNIVVKVTDDKGILLYEDTLNKLKNKGIKFREKIGLNPSESKKFSMTIDVNKDMENDAQGVESDVIMGIHYILQSKQEAEDSDKILPKTGSISSKDIVLIGTVMVGAGYIVYRRR